MKNGKHAFVHAINEDGKNENIIVVHSLVDWITLVYFIHTKSVDPAKLSLYYNLFGSGLIVLELAANTLVHHLWKQ